MAFTPAHLTNLLLALGCGSPVDAVETVALFRGLRPDQETRKTSTQVAKTGNPLMSPSDYQSIYTEAVINRRPVVTTEDFGSALDVLVETLADPTTLPTISEAMRNARVLITIKPQPLAEIIIQFPGEDHPSLKTVYRLVQQQPDLLTAGSRSSPASELQRVFYGAAFEALATIWRETRGNSHPGPVQSGGQHKTPAKKNAALAGAAPSNSGLQADPEKGAAPQKSSLNICDHTACVRVSSRGFDPGVGQIKPWSRLHAHTSDHHALFQA